MYLKRFAQFLAIGLPLVLALATGAQAQDKQAYSVLGGGGQLHIGNGLMLPIQPAAMAATNDGDQFPNLRIPVRQGGPPPVISGTTAMGPETDGTKMAYQRRLEIGAGVLHKEPEQTTVGVRFSNETVYAVGSNVEFSWPAQKMVLTTDAGVHASLAESTKQGPGAIGGQINWNNPLGRFGGPGQFRLSPSDTPDGLVPEIGVTVYVKLPGNPLGQSDPPCTHSLFGGNDSDCYSFLAAGAAGTATLGIGAATQNTVAIPGAAVPNDSNLALLQMSGLPNTVMGGNILNAVAISGGIDIVNNANSQGGPWTTGTIVVSQTGAAPDETFTLRGADNRNATGRGTIQLVAAAVSNRSTTGPNANRGWVRLELGAPVGVGVPTTQWWGLAAIAVLTLLGFGYARRRRLFAHEG